MKFQIDTKIYHKETNRFIIKFLYKKTHLKYLYIMILLLIYYLKQFFTLNSLHYLAWDKNLVFSKNLEKKVSKMLWQPCNKLFDNLETHQLQSLKHQCSRFIYA